MNRKWILRIFVSLFFACLLIPITAMAYPGPQRMLAPGLFGFKEIGRNIFTHPSMPADKEKQALRDIRDARKVVSDFFGYAVPRPVIVLCHAENCNNVFGRKDVRGVAYGKRVIRLNPKGINLMIASHELMHTTLKERVGEFRTYFGAVPAWFDEGLAVIISKDERYDNNISEEVLQSLLKQPNWWQWGDLIKQYGWRDVYGGSKLLVSRLHGKIGKDGLLKIIDRVAQGEEFDQVLSDLYQQELATGFKS